MKKVLKFSAPWCGPCKMLSKTLQNVTTELQIEEIDIDQNKELAQKYMIRGVPTLVMIDGENEIKRKVGVVSVDELNKWFNE